MRFPTGPFYEEEIKSQITLTVFDDEKARKAFKKLQNYELRDDASRKELERKFIQVSLRNLFILNEDSTI